MLVEILKPHGGCWDCEPVFACGVAPLAAERLLLLLSRRTTESEATTFGKLSILAARMISSLTHRHMRPSPQSLAGCYGT